MSNLEKLDVFYFCLDIVQSMYPSMEYWSQRSIAHRMYKEAFKGVEIGKMGSSKGVGLDKDKVENNVHYM